MVRKRGDFMGILDDEFGGGGIIPTNPIRPRPPQWTPPQDIPETPNLKPGKPDIGLEETPELDEGSSGYIEQPDDGFTNVTERPSYWGNAEPLTDDQKYMLLGIVILAAMFGFVNK